MLKEYVDRDNSNFTLNNVISSVLQKQSELNCEDKDCEEMIFEKPNPTSLKLQNFDILKNMTKIITYGSNST